MPTFSQHVIVHYTTEQMYDLVNDVNAYSTFIPLCIAAEVHEELNHKVRATIKIAKGKIGFQFTTVNTLEKGRSIAINLESGPFKSLQGIWRFSPVGQGKCSIDLHFEFEFSNKLLGVALGRIFAQLCDSMVESFRKEAVVRYG